MLKYKLRVAVIEAVRWTPTENGRQRGGWPRNRKWREAHRWMVYIVSQRLFVPHRVANKAARVARPGDWILWLADGVFDVRTNEEFLAEYEPVNA